MNQRSACSDASGSEPDDLDVLIVGAGLAGIDAAYRLQAGLRNVRYAILEARDEVGGTWSLFRYPGIRSDSDMHTLGFPFRPWRGERSIADGADIRAYIADTAREFGIDRTIRFGHRVVAASWSSEQAIWTVTYETRLGSGQLRCRLLYLCSGYYDYAEGYRPDFPHQERFTGRWIHPQHWPEDLDPNGQRIVVIGSGATAVTLVPALASRGASVTMLQRSPSYIVARPAKDRIANRLLRWLPHRLAAPLVRWKNVGTGILVYRYARRRPKKLRALIKRATREALPHLPHLDRHFTPRYEPWDQRLCLVPNGDLFTALAEGRAEIVTDTVEQVLTDGLQLASGRTIPADAIVTATGLKIKLMGGIHLTVDGVPVEPGGRMIYKGMMMEGIPNAILAFGYTNASWTLKVDLVARYVVRLLRHMRRTGMTICVVTKPDGSVDPRPMLDLASGYVTRAGSALPVQGSSTPWRIHQNYLLDLIAYRRGSVEDGVMHFSKPRTGARS